MGYVFASFAGQLPLLAVMVAGFALVNARRAQLGPRSTMLALIGLAVLTLELVMSVVWNIMFPRLIASLDMPASGYGVISFVVGIALTIVMALGIGLLIAALVTRKPAGEPAYEPPA